MAPVTPFPPGAGWIERTCFENALHISSIPAERERGSRSSEAFHLLPALLSAGDANKMHFLQPLFHLWNLQPGFD